DEMPLRGFVHGGRGLIEKNNRRLANKEPGQEQCLLLATGQAMAAFKNAMVQSLWKLAHEFVRANHRKRSKNLVLRGLRRTQHDIVAQRAMEKAGVLRQQADITANISRI